MINAGESVQVFSTIIGGESKEWRNGFVFHSYEDYKREVKYLEKFVKIREEIKASL